MVLYFLTNVWRSLANFGSCAIKPQIHSLTHPSSGMYNTRHYESTLQQGFRYRVLLATKSRRNHRQRASGQRGKVVDDASAASCSAIGYEARHHASYF
ncbi:hypothetical protein TNCV_2163981 [Trichonephila clavipes]|nr:hypothetical protein TNCV_2163981 [Trichonephila clavipes]